MNRLAYVSLVLIGAFATPANAEEKYVSKEGKYSVVFPKAPKELTQDLPLPEGKSKLHMALVEVSKDQALIGTYNDYPADVTDKPAQKILEGVRDGAKGDGEIVTDKEITYGKAKVPGREYHFTKGAFHQRFRIYLKGSRLYQVGVVGATKDVVLAKDADKFLDSFEIQE